MEKISSSQLCALIVMFQIGSSPLFLLGKTAGADAWIAVFLAMVVGLVLLLLTLYIQRLEPEKELMEIFNTYFGKYLGYVFGLAYFIYFSYSSIRNLREFGDLMNTYMLPNTPLSFLIVCMLLVSGYAVWQGIEVFGRITQILAPMIVSIYILFIIIILATGLFDLHLLEPILDNGFKKVIEAAVPSIVSFPFGEMVLFLMIWKFVTPKQKLTQTTVRCFIVSGILLIVTNAILIGSLGPIAQMSLVPFIQVMSHVQIASFIERLDPFVAALLFTGGFIKLTAYYLCAAFVGKHLFKMDQRYIVVGVGVVLFIGSLLFRSYMQQIWLGFDFNVKYHFPVFQIYIPVLLLIVMLVRSRLRSSTNG
ncbi:GerAB/ArcD/ProY family transporter [Paenibacillus cremeus]|uniref:GerAB/ArcD/ProY family transporter n=1 Tax=Paenibacillus cremeus TaxID=2163881 RepID=A0A559K9S8_9BACL|nr:GerAB/ArcD/ProY family transporter [Paenibacillus cremeus]TVY08872.1 GerAB/ArcD/ProY family transporter [Paenibacillus cremeus]